MKPSAQHMAEMPYSQAVINEVLRVSNVSFTTLPYTNCEDINVAGCHIPKNSSIICDLVSVHKDPEIYPNPEQFLPERFLDSQGNLTKSPHFLPFSIGEK